jgi:hypothetical protein
MEEDKLFVALLTTKKSKNIPRVLCKEVLKLGILPDDVRVFEFAKTDAKNPCAREHSITKAHQIIWKHALQQGFKKALVFEDDVEITGKAPQKRFEIVLDQAKHLDTWDVIFLGSMSWAPITPTGYPNLFRTYLTGGAHAYLISERGMKRGVNKYVPADTDQSGCFFGLMSYHQVDGKVLNFGMKNYTVVPHIATQNVTPTGIKKLAPNVQITKWIKWSNSIALIIFLLTFLLTFLYLGSISI